MNLNKILNTLPVRNILDWLNFRRHVTLWLIYRRNRRMSNLMSEARGIGITQARISEIASSIRVPRKHWTNLFNKALEREINEKRK